MTAIAFGADDRVRRAGDTMSGNLTVPSLSITGQLNANSTFTSGIPPWVPGLNTTTGLSQSTTFVYPGASDSARVVPSGVDAIAYIESEMITCTGNEAFTTQCWVYCPTGYSPGAGNGFSLSVNWYDAGTTYISTSATVISLAAGLWIPVVNEYTSPSTAAQVTILPYLSGTPSSSVIIYLYGVMIAQASSLNMGPLIAQSLQLPAAGKSGQVLTADAYGNATWQPVASSAITVPATLSGASASSPILTVANTTATPTAPGAQHTAAAAGDQVLGMKVSGDTVQRLLIDSNGKHSWGPGGSTATDTDLYRSAAGVLTTDGAMTVGGTLGVTGASTVAALSATTGSFSSTLGVTGAVTMSSTLAVTGTLTDGNAIVPTSTRTITGTTSATLALAGPTITPAAGMAFQAEMWGTVTTTVDTQTAVLGVYLGGVGGTLLFSFGNSNPNSSATVTGAAIRMRATLTFLSSTSATVGGQLDLNFFVNTVNQQGPTTVSASSQQLVLAITPSATAMSWTINGGYWRRIA